MDHVLGLQCVICGQRYEPGEVSYVCPRHGDEGILDVLYDYPLIGRQLEQTGIAPFGSGAGMWRYKALLPVRTDSPVPPITVGDTPLPAAPRIAASLNLKEVWVKDEGRQPSASLKDRASAFAVVKAREVNAEIIAAASTGNAAAALALHCASVRQTNVIFVPAAAPQAKIAQLLVFGSKVLLVDGSYDDAFDLCLEACREFGWYNRNTAYNPYMAEGKKTVSYEICEQLGMARGGKRWQTPDVVFVPVGDGCIISGVYKGFKDLLALGWIDRLPRIMGVQSAGSDYLWQVWSKGEDVMTKPRIKADTLADSISSELPRARVKALSAVNETGGAFIRVTDEEIVAAIPRLARGAGVFAEPAAAAAYAALEQAAATDIVSLDESVVLLVTGSGLKDIHAAMRSVELPQPIKTVSSCNLGGVGVSVLSSG